LGSSGDYVYSATVEQTGIDDTGTSVPTEFKLLGNYPNPFNGKTIISLFSPTDVSADFSIYDIGGRRVMSDIVQLKAGDNSIPVDFENIGGNRAASGMYFYRVGIEGLGHVGNMLYLK